MAPTGQLVEFAIYLTGHVARLVCGVGVGIGTAMLTSAGVARLGNRRPLHRTRTARQSVVFWGGIVGSLGYLGATVAVFSVGQFDWTGIAGIGVAALGAAVGGVLAVRLAVVPDQTRVHDQIRDDELLEIKLSLTLVFVVYLLLRWWSVREDIYGSVGAADRQAAEPAASWFVAATVGYLGVILVLALAGLWVLQRLWADVIPAVEAMIAEYNQEERQLAASLEQPKATYTRVIGLALILGGFLWQLLRTTPGGTEIIEVAFVGMAILCLYLVVAAIADIRFLKATGASDVFVRKRLKREGSRLVVYVASAALVFATLVFVTNALLGIYYERITRSAFQQLPATTEAILARESPTAVTLVEFYGFLATDVIWDLGSQLLMLAFSVGLAILFLPYMVKYLYLEGVRTGVRVGATYLMFLIIAVVVNVGLRGQIDNLTQAGMASILPSIGAGVSTQILDWFYEEREYVDCRACGERIRQDTNYCGYCGEEIE